MKKVILAAGLIVGTLSSQAQDNELFLNVGNVLAVGNLSDNYGSSGTSFEFGYSRKFSDNWGATAQLQVLGAGVDVNDLESDLSVDNPGVIWQINHDGHVMTNIFVGGFYSLPKNNHEWRFNLDLGVSGIAPANYTATAVSSGDYAVVNTTNDAATGFGMSLGVAYRWNFADHWGLNLDLKYTGATGESFYTIYGYDNYDNYVYDSGYADVSFNAIVSNIGVAYRF